MLSFDELTNTDQFKSGDILLVESDNSWLSKLICFFARSSFTHAAMLVKIDSSWFVLETRLKRQFHYQMMPADWWFQRYPNEKTYIGRMPKQTHCLEEEIKNTALCPKESVRPYELRWLAIIYILQEWFGLYRPNVRKKKSPMICSTFIQEVWEKAGVIKKGNYKTAGGLVDVIGGKETLIPFSYQSFTTTVNTKNNKNNRDRFQHAALNT